jgi:hypothetical protein
MIIHIKGNQVTTIYQEKVDLSRLGPPVTRRASNVEPGADGLWRADLALSGGPVLAGFTKRSAALAAEFSWLEQHLSELN